MPDVITFNEAIQDSADCTKRNLMLGNGFSIACEPDIFHYGSLFGQADFSSIPEARQAFDALGTQDFEVVIRALEQGSHLVPIYATKATETAERMAMHAEQLKELLISTVAHNHPENPGHISDDRFWACREFLKHFLSGPNRGRVYTINYDLLLYWALMHDDNPFEDNPADIITIDGFGQDYDDPDADYVIWKAETRANQQCVHYLHGALHLYDAGSELKKYTWVRSGLPLIDQARDAMQQGMYPLFVSEGESSAKMAKVRHSAYLQHSFKSFHSIMDQSNQALFIFGHSPAENDSHILNQIGRGKCQKVYISLYGDPDSKGNREIIQRAEIIASLRRRNYPMKLTFFDASSANVWG
ncbi:MAG TPA: DUF4917 family protein [Gammaproteobacteria bacterium]|nr:DUF4917 family protein [Gammaproteobacteria bacterium]